MTKEELLQKIERTQIPDDAVVNIQVFTGDLLYGDTSNIEYKAESIVYNITDNELVIL